MVREEKTFDLLILYPVHRRTTFPTYLEMTYMLLIVKINFRIGVIFLSTCT